MSQPNKLPPTMGLSNGSSAPGWILQPRSPSRPSYRSSTHLPPLSDGLVASLASLASRPQGTNISSPTLNLNTVPTKTLNPTQSLTSTIPSRLLLLGISRPPPLAMSSSKTRRPASRTRAPSSVPVSSRSDPSSRASTATKVSWTSRSPSSATASSRTQHVPTSQDTSGTHQPTARSRTPSWILTSAPPPPHMTIAPPAPALLRSTARTHQAVPIPTIPTLPTFQHPPPAPGPYTYPPTWQCLLISFPTPSASTVVVNDYLHSLYARRNYALSPQGHMAGCDLYELGDADLEAAFPREGPEDLRALVVGDLLRLRDKLGIVATGRIKTTKPATSWTVPSRGSGSSTSGVGGYRERSPVLQRWRTDLQYDYEKEEIKEEEMSEERKAIAQIKKRVAEGELPEGGYEARIGGKAQGFRDWDHMWETVGKGKDRRTRGWWDV